MEENEKKSAKEKLKIMLKFIKKYALYSILDKEIYWKTRVMYLILKQRINDEENQYYCSCI